jgi:hypothetical protein
VTVVAVELWWSTPESGHSALEPVIETVSVHASTAGPSLSVSVVLPGREEGEGGKSFFPVILVEAKKEEIGNRITNPTPIL